MALIAWYKLDGNLVDEIGDNHLTYERDTGKLVSEAGKIGGCYNRDTLNSGTDFFRTINKVNFTGDFSFSLWAKVVDATSSANGLLTHHNHSRNAGAGITVKRISDTDYRISCNTGTGSARTYVTYYGTSNIKDKWSLLTLVFIKETNSLSLWVNGVKEKEITYSLLVEEDYIDLFNWSTNYGNSNNYRPAASIDDVRIYDHALSEEEIGKLSQAKVLHYRFSGGYNDSSGYSNHATSSGHQTLTVDEERNSCQFNGSGSLATNQIFFDDLNQEWTSMAWVKITDDTAGNQQLNNFNLGNRLIHSTSNGKALLYGNSGTDDHYVYSTNATPTNRWVHVAFVYRVSDKICKIYYDGELGSPSPFWREGRLPRGFSGITNFGTYLRGLLSDVRVYATALSPEDIREVYYSKTKLDEKGNLITQLKEGAGLLSKILNTESTQASNFSELGITDGLTAYYPLNRNAYDYVNRKDGVVNGATIAEGMNGKSCYEFDGASSHINCGDVHNYRDNLSICAWVNVPTTDQGGVVVKSDTNTWANNSYVFMRSRGGAFRVYLSGENGTQYLDFLITDIAGKGWAFCCMSLSGTNLTLYLNGNKYNTATRTVGRLNANSNPFYIGKGYTTTYFTGKIQSVRIYNKALTEEEVNIIYDLEKEDFTQMKIGTDSVYISGEFDETH